VVHASAGDYLVYDGDRHSVEVGGDFESEFYPTPYPEDQPPQPSAS